MRRGLVAAPIVAGAGALALITAPGFVRDAVAERVLSATGLATVIESASLGTSGVALRGVRIGGKGNGPSIAIDELDVDANPLGLLFAGRSAVRGVVVRGVKAKAALYDPATRALREKLRARAQAKSDAKDATDEDAPFLRFEALTLELEDENGSLMRVEGARGARENGALELFAKRIALGGKSAELADAKLLGTRGDHEGTAISSGEVGGATLRLPAEGELTAERSLYARLLRAASGDAPAAGAAAPATPTAKPEARAKAPSKAGALLARFATAARLELKNGRVLRADESAVLTGLTASATLEGDGSVGLSGKGRGEQGAVGWDLRVWPQTLRAEGTVDVKELPLSVLAPLLPAVPWHEPEQSRVEASLRLTAESADKITLAGEVKLTDVGLSTPRLSAVPVRNIDITAGGRGVFVPAARRLEITESEVGFGHAHVSLAGNVTWAPPEYAIDLVAKLPTTRCNDAVHSIPEDLLGDLSLATFQGSLGGEITLKVDSKDLPSTVLDVDVADRCDFVTVPALADLRRFEQPFVHTVLEPDGSVFEMETGPGTANWTYLGDISPFFVHAVLAHEDAGFYAHKGFSLPHIRAALARDLEAGRYVVGASTITMQLVKNVFLHREKTLARKIQEVLLTWWIERVMDKSDILELYFNVIEYGPSVYGIRNAARHYFGRLPAQLSPAESAYLANILPAPKRYHSQYENNAVSAATLERMRKLIVRLQDRGSYGPEAARFGLDELAHFRFVPEGSIAPGRVLPTDVGPLPHMGAEEFWGSQGAPEGDDELPQPHEDEWGDPIERTPAHAPAPSH